MDSNGLTCTASGMEARRDMFALRLVESQAEKERMKVEISMLKCLQEQPQQIDGAKVGWGAGALGAKQPGRQPYERGHPQERKALGDNCIAGMCGAKCC